MENKFNLKSRAQNIRVEISQNIKDQQTIVQFIAFLKQNEIFPILDPDSRFQISFSLKRDIIKVLISYADSRLQY